MRIVADVHERGGAVPRLLSEAGVSVEIKSLSHGDYAIGGGVPRFVDAGAYASSFGYQWNRFRTVQLDSVNGSWESARTLAATSGWTDEDYRGRLVLDAGVGAGRYAEVVADRGGEVVGVDLTRAVDAAYANVGRRPGVHLIQADIFAMPFDEIAPIVAAQKQRPGSSRAARAVGCEEEQW